MNFGLSNILRWLFMPHFNEVALFSMSLTCIFLVFTNFDFSTEFGTNSGNSGNYGIVIIYGAFLCGLLLSIFHAFSKREKSSFEKIFMLLFASMISGLGGIWAGAYLWYQTESWVRIIPIWNIISGYLLLASVRDTRSIGQRIADENASLPEIGISTLITIIIFCISQYIFGAHWTATFAVSVAYATNLNGPLLGLFLTTSEDPEKA